MTISGFLFILSTHTLEAPIPSTCIYVQVPLSNTDRWGAAITVLPCGCAQVCEGILPGSLYIGLRWHPGDVEGLKDGCHPGCATHSMKITDDA